MLSIQDCPTPHSTLFIVLFHSINAGGRGVSFCFFQFSASIVNKYVRQEWQQVETEQPVDWNRPCSEHLTEISHQEEAGIFPARKMAILLNEMYKVFGMCELTDLQDKMNRLLATLGESEGERRKIVKMNMLINLILLFPFLDLSSFPLSLSLQSNCA